MGRFGTLTILAASLASGALASGAWAQERGDGCLKPLPTPSGGAYDPVPPPRSDPGVSRGLPDLFVGADGSLCRRFELASRTLSLDQAAIHRPPQPGKAFLLSAGLPGAGQWFLGQNRWPAYFAVEAWAWIQFLDWRREGHDVQDRYRDLAWLVARRVSTGPRTEAGWEYYEALTKFQSSGAYDSDPLTPGVQPEEDPATFNGSVWALAKDIYLPGGSEDPVEEGSEPFQKAFSYYLSKAYAPALAWDWGSNKLLQEEYGSLIKKADEALRSSTGMIGVILANHLLSAVDALVSGRLGIAGEVEPALELQLLPGPFQTSQVALNVRLSTPLGHVR